jgi:hypothetical protein
VLSSHRNELQGEVKMRVFLASLAAAVCLASAAAAQTLEPPPSAEQIQTRASEIIANAGAQDLFVQEPNDRAVTLRHTRSGMLCRFALAYNGNITIIPSEGFGIPRGDDVACAEDSEFGSFTLYATRRGTASNNDEALAGAIAALRALFPDAREIQLSELPAAPPAPNAMESRTAAFMIRLQGRDTFTRVSVFTANGWEYKLRFTSPDQRANILADILWWALLNDLANYAPPAATTPN